MVFVNTDVCNGCGECISVCPSGAILLQNNHAFIDQELCQACETCVDSCPLGAILVGEPLPVGSKIIKIPSSASGEIVPASEQFQRTALRNAVLPMIGSAILWTGRELVPRLADLALRYIDQRVQPSRSVRTQKLEKSHNRPVVNPMKRRGRRRQRRRRNQL
jgi:Fe-S-cluster-containing hydrogenase component 2